MVYSDQLHNLDYQASMVQTNILHVSVGAYPKSTTRERNQEKLQFGLPNPLLKALLQLHTNAKASNPCLINVNN
jgi:hypothetical protein